MAVRAVLKVDDDLAWNVDRMFVYLSEIADDDKVVLHCRSVKNPLVSRDVNARWLVSFTYTFITWSTSTHFRYVTPEEYPYKYFPEYCLSPVYAATPKTIAALANATARIPHLWVSGQRTGFQGKSRAFPARRRVESRNRGLGSGSHISAAVLQRRTRNL